MKKLALVVIFLFAFAATTLAQDVPAAEVFGGYSFVHCDTEVYNLSCNLSGWNGSVAINANKWIGAVADFSGHYGSIGSGINTSDIKAHSFIFGPRFSARLDKVTPFAQALFGATNWKVSAGGSSTSETDFAMALGGGLDINAGSRIAIRLVQAEYFMTRDDGDSSHNFRYSAGIVFKLGKR